uniref:AAA+ ATPase domain-containing protein n=1 Tax=Oryza punctata TaxID=4537 RepID=A0A0E0LLC5_ORYPU
MDHHRLPLVAAAGTSESKHGRALNACKKALATAASVAACSAMARGLARELLPDELRATAWWAARLVRTRLFAAVAAEEKKRRTLYLATKMDPRDMPRLAVACSPRRKEADGSWSWSARLCAEPGDSATDVFDGVEFKWSFVETGGDDDDNDKGHRDKLFEVTFDAEHTAMALDRYIPFVKATAEQMYRPERELKIYMNEGSSWRGIVHHHPATFDTIAMDPDLKKSIVDDLDRFLKRKEYYRRIGKAWKRGYLLYGPPRTGKSSLIAAMANYLRFNLYDLDLSEVHSNSALQRLLIDMPNRSILVVEDIDCCFSANPREHHHKTPPPDLHLTDSDDDDDDEESDRKVRPPPQQQQQNVTLSGLLNFIDGLWSTSGEQRVIVFTTNYRDRLDAALLRPGRMDMHIYMGYCGWDAFKTLAHNYFLVDDHPLFPEIRELLAGVEVTPAEVSEMLLRCDDADVALRGVMELLRDRGRKARSEAEIKNDGNAA